MDFSSSPVDMWVVLCQPGALQNNVVLLSKVEYKEVLHRILPVNPEMKFDLIADHPSHIVGPICVLGVHGLSEFLQWPIHSSGEMEVDAADCCSTVY